MKRVTLGHNACVVHCNRLDPVVDWAGLGWAGLLGWAALGLAGSLGWAGLRWPLLGWAGRGRLG